MRRVTRALLALLLGIPLLGQAPPPGSWLQRLLEGQVPGLAIEGLEGVLRATPTARRVTLADHAGIWLEAEEVRVALAPSALLRGVVRVQALEAARLRVLRAPLPDPAAPRPAPDPSAGLFPALPSLPVDVALDRLAIARLELEAGVLGTGAAFELTGNATLGGGRLLAGIGVQRLDAPGLARVDLALEPAENRLVAQIEATEPAGGLGPTLLGRPSRPFSVRLRLDGPASGAALDLAAALGPEIGLQAAGTVRAGAAGDFAAVLSGEATADPLLPEALAGLGNPARFSIDAAIDPARLLTLRTLSLETPAGILVATGTGNLGPDGQIDLSANLTLAASRQFARLLPPGLGWDAARAEARVAGTITAPRLRLEVVPEGLITGVAQADAVLGRAPLLTATASLPGPTFDVQLEAAGGIATARGSAAPLDATVTLALPELAPLGAGLAGGLDASLGVTGSLDDPDLVLEARSARLAAAGQVLEDFALRASVVSARRAPAATATADGRLGGLPLRLTLTALPEPGAVRLREAGLRLGPARLEAAGRLDTASKLFAGDARLMVDDLAPLGRLGGLTGLGGRLALTARLQPRGVEQRFELRLDAPTLAYAGNTARLQATAAGTADDVALDVSARGSVSGQPAAIAARLRAAGTEAGRQVDLATLSLETMGEVVRLAAPARATVGRDGGVRLAPLAFVTGRGGRLDAQGSWGPTRADLGLRITALPVALAGPFAPGVEPQGTLSGDLRLDGPTAAPEFRAALRGDGLRAGADWARRLPTLTLRAEASGSARTAQLRAELVAGTAGRINATARFPQGLAPTAPLSARIDGTLALAPLAQPFLAGGADRVTGTLNVALRADGTIGTPRLGGEATLTDGSYRNAATGIRLADIAGRLTGDGTRLVIERLAAWTAGNGTLGASGSIDVGAAGLPADLTLTARDAQPWSSALGSATFGADLRVSGPLAGGARVAGEVRIARAELRVPETLPTAVPVLTPVRVQGLPRCAPRAATEACAGLPPPAAKAAGPPAPPFTLDVRLVAPSRVFVRGRGVDAELGGEIRLGGTLAAPTADGGFRLRRGTLSILARQLTFARGQVDFSAGTLTPQLDLLATAPARDVVVTVAVTGSSADPRIVFSSTPELPQDEALARLLFDRPTSGLSAFELAQLAAAVASLTGVGGGLDPFDRVRGALGLDRLGVGGGAAGAGPAIEAGRYVAPGVFLGVRQGVQGGQPGVGVQVEITPRIKLEAQTSTGPAGDRLGVTYEFEY